MATAWAALNYAHPFREGNGRTLRIYLDSRAEHSGWQIHWDELDPENQHRRVEYFVPGS